MLLEGGVGAVGWRAAAGAPALVPYAPVADLAVVGSPDGVVVTLTDISAFEQTRAKLAEHPIEEVGAKLRAMMPWIAKNKLVDKAKN